MQQQEFGQQENEEELRKREEEARKLRKNTVLLLIKYGARVDTQNFTKQSLFKACLSNGNYELLDLFIDPIEFTKENRLIFDFATLIYNPRLRPIFDQILAKSKVDVEIMNDMDDAGFTPFLRYMMSLLESAPTYYSNIRNYVIYQLKRMKYQGESDFNKARFNISYTNYAERKYNDPRINQYFMYSPPVS